MRCPILSASGWASCPTELEYATGVELSADSVLVFKYLLAALVGQFKPNLRGFTAGAHAHEIAFCGVPGVPLQHFHAQREVRSAVAGASATMLYFLASWLWSSAVVCVSSVFMS